MTRLASDVRRWMEDRNLQRVFAVRLRENKNMAFTV